MKSRIAISLLFILTAATAFASDATWSADPLSALHKTMYGTVTNILLGSGNVPAKTYSPKSTDAVGSFSLLVGRLADAEYLFCSIALGDKSPAAPKLTQTSNRRAGIPATTLATMCLWAGRWSAPKANNNEPLKKSRKGE
jgi:hypothetical protein